MQTSISTSVLLVLLVTSTACLMVVASVGPNCGGPCIRNKLCCYDLDTVAASDARCFNPERSDDHCGSCDIQCEKGHDAVFDRCESSACTADFIPLTRQRRDCDGSPLAPVAGQLTSGGGQVTFAKPVLGTNIAAHIIVTGGTANSVYSVRLIQVLGNPGPDCFNYAIATLNTNLLGNGEVTVSEPLLPGSTSAFVYLNNQANPNVDQFGTATIRTIP